MNAINGHNSITIKVKQINEFFKLMVFIFYYGATPALLLLMFLHQDKDVNKYLKLGYGLIIVVIFGGVALMHLISALLTNAAHKSYSMLFSLLSKKKKVSLNEMMKIQLFIEKLSSPEIGFYCYELFPMNNYEFYQYVANSVSFYFLIMGLLQINKQD